MVRIDTENIGSLRVIEKMGAKEGERMEKAYGLAKDKGEDGVVPFEKLRDLRVWWIERP